MINGVFDQALVFFFSKNFTADLTVERETYEQSRTGLNELYLNVENELEKERQEKKVSSKPFV